MTHRSFLSRLLVSAKNLTIAFLTLLLGLLGFDAAAQGISQQAARQIQAFATDKAARTPAQKKLSSRLIFASRMNRGLPAVAGVQTVQTGIAIDAAGATVVDIRANVDDALLETIRGLGGSVLEYHVQYRSIRARMPLVSLEKLAADSRVIFIAPKQEYMKNGPAATSPKAAAAPAPPVSWFPGRAERVKSQLSRSLAKAGRKPLALVASEGVVTHRADLAQSTFGAAGAGVKVGVLSDGVTSLAALTAAGILPTVTVISGQAGPNGADEGTAMLEIVHDVAPAAQLYFATADPTIETFAANILALRAAGCDIIVDDVSYFVESPFQAGQAASVTSTYDSGVVTQAVNDVTASGALYFSAAANSGNWTWGTSGTWEGDYVDGGAADGVLTGVGDVHDFGGGTLYDTAYVTDYCFLFWSDPLGAATDDYDLYVLSPDGTGVYAVSNDTQDGTQDPLEECFRSGEGFTADSRIVIAKKAGAAIRALHMDTFGSSPLSISTSGATYGHNGGRNTVTTAATYWNSARTGTRPFVGGAANPTEVFSSDGPRKIFFNPDGTAITPGNFLFGSNGGTTLTKPDIATADGVSTKTPGFLPFFGTSAAAPHAAAVGPH